MIKVVWKRAPVRRMIDLMKARIKRIFFLFGIVMAALAFLATAAEMAAHGVDGDLGLLPSAADVWRALSLASFEAALSHQSIVAWLSNAGILDLPGWLILGAPGLVLIIVCHESDDGPISEQDHSLFLFDELAKQAREEGFSDQSDSELLANFDFEPADESYAREDASHETDAKNEAKNAERDFLLTDKKDPA